MLFAGGSRRAAVLAAALLICFTPARAGDNPAHKLAEKFAGEKSDSPEQSAEARRKAEEDRKHEAERLAQEKLKAEARQRADAALKAEREKQRPIAKKAESQPPAPKTPSAAEENDILARARAEQEQRKAAEKREVTDDEARRVIEEAERASRQLEELLAKTEPPSQKPATEQPAVPVAPTPVAEPSAPPPAAKPAVVATEPAPQPAEDEQAKLRQAEAARAAAVAQARRIWRQTAERQETHARALAAEAEKERARIAAATPPTPAPAPPAATPVAAPVVPPAPPAGPPPERVAPLPPPPATPPPAVVAEAPKPAPGIKPVAAPETPKAEPATPAQARGLEERVTVLVVMRPGNYGIRRNDKTADPILCAPDGCYISAGIEAPANFLKGSKALGIGNTFGARSGACRNVLGCVFRAIPVRDAPLMLQPVDMHIIKHDRRRPHVVTAESQCGLFGGKLSCNRGVYADDYTLWIVPESVADAVGPEALQRAVKEGLNGPRSATLQPR